MYPLGHIVSDTSSTQSRGCFRAAVPPARAPTRAAVTTARVAVSTARAATIALKKKEGISDIPLHFFICLPLFHGHPRPRPRPRRCGPGATGRCSIQPRLRWRRGPVHGGATGCVRGVCVGWGGSGGRGCVRGSVRRVKRGVMNGSGASCLEVRWYDREVDQLTGDPELPIHQQRGEPAVRRALKRCLE